MRNRPPTTKRILLAAGAALVVGLGGVSLVAGFSESFPLRVVQGLAVFAAGGVIIGGAVILAMIRLAGWRDPISESEFDAIVERAERLAAAESWGDSEDYEGVEDEDELFDPYNEDDFRALVRAAIDDLPIEFHRALEHVAIVVSDG